MTEQISVPHLAAKWARQAANCMNLSKTVSLAQENLRREMVETDATAATLKELISREKPKLLVAIGHGRYVLVHSYNGSFGVYASVEIVEETK